MKSGRDRCTVDAESNLWYVSVRLFVNTPFACFKDGRVVAAVVLSSALCQRLKAFL